ncbi:MAG: hypothetical protein WC516_03115 [Patescibacteria group bacterium]
MKRMLAVTICCLVAAVALSGCMTTSGEFGSYAGPIGSGATRYMDPKRPMDPSRQREGGNPFPSGAAYAELDKAMDADLAGKTEAADKHRRAVLELEETRSKTAVSGGGFGLGMGGVANGYGVGMNCVRGAGPGWSARGVICNAYTNYTCQVYVDGKLVGQLSPTGPTSYLFLALPAETKHIVVARDSQGKSVFEKELEITGVPDGQTFKFPDGHEKCTVDWKVVF